jgi:hypothetical protein
MSEAIMLHVGEIAAVPGYRLVDRLATGGMLTDYADGTVTELRVSETMEYLPMPRVKQLVEHWRAKLTPGGILTLTVPDFLDFQARYVKGDVVDMVELVGDQRDSQHHGCSIYDAESLVELLCAAKFEQLRQQPSAKGKLTIRCIKPLSDVVTVKGVYGIESVPRYGPMMHAQCLIKALLPLAIPFRFGYGAYWDHVICDLMEEIMKEKPDTRYLLTADFDTVVVAQNVLDLYRLMESTGYDAICALQMKRALFTKSGPDGRKLGQIGLPELRRAVLPIDTGHFGLTMIRVESLKKMPKPWMCATPSPKGEWHDGQIDPDVSFWNGWRKAGLKLALAPMVVVGHLQEMVMWPNKQLLPHYQTADEYERVGPPVEAWA